MKVVLVLFDSLNRHLLGAYGGTRIKTPNFNRLAKRSMTFEKHYTGSVQLQSWSSPPCGSR